MSQGKEFTYSDVSEHATKKDLYIVVHDKVYDCTSFVDEHPYVFPSGNGTPPLAFSEAPCSVEAALIGVIIWGMRV